MLVSFRRYTRLAVILLCVSYCCCRVNEESKITSDSSFYNVISENLVKIKESQKNIDLIQDEFLTNKSQGITVIKNTISSANDKKTAASSDRQEITYANCEEALKDERPNGVYTIYDPAFEMPPFKVFCLRDFYSKEKLWTLIQRRESNSSHFVDFKRNWQEYKKGFGNVEYDHWLGLDKIYALTNAGYHEMWIDVKSVNGTSLNFSYDFQIGNETEAFASKILCPDVERIYYTCISRPFHTIDRGYTDLINKYGGEGFWISDGKYETNYNGQGYKDGKPYSLIYKNSTELYVHIALRENKNAIKDLIEYWEKDYNKREHKDPLQEFFESFGKGDEERKNKDPMENLIGDLKEDDER